MFGDQGQARGFWLTLGMGRAAGADLAGAVVQGWLTRAELGRLVATCNRCALTEACTALLARPSTGAMREGPPPWCPNGSSIAALAPPPAT